MKEINAPSHNKDTTMKISTACVLILALAGNVMAGKPGGCTDVQISMTFMATTAGPAAIWNDDPTKVYQNGVARCPITVTDPRIC